MTLLDLQSALAGQYFLERELGRGGMGIVFLARELRLDRLVAIKVLPPALAARPELRERFLREARTAARLSHPHVVPIHRVDETAGFVWLAMGYVDGGTLADRLRARGGTLPPADVVRLVREVGWALAYAHAAGIVHRDVKPENILFDAATGRALVTDFGIAQLSDAALGDGARLTDEGRIMGTAHYMSPEQAAGEPLDGRSDLYALGCVAYQALAGRPPFDAPSVHALLAKHLTQTPPPLDGVPPRLARAVLQCLAKHPDDRPATGEALAELVDASAAETRALPPVLREWAEARDPFAVVYGLWTGGCLTALLVLVQIAALFGRRATGPSMTELPLVVLALLPLVPHTLFRLRLTWRALAAGYEAPDLRLALLRLQAQRERGADEERRVVPRWLARAIAAAVYGAGALVALSLMLYPLMRKLGAGPRSPTVTPVLFMVALGLAAVGSALGVTWPGRPLQGRWWTRVRLAWLDSRPGQQLLRGIARRARSGAAAVIVPSRPTEQAIGLAAAELFAALPDPTRRALDDLPGIIRGLEREAEQMRLRAEQLDAHGRTARQGAADAAADRRAAVAAELAAARDAAVRRRDAAVTALESIRLDLLRLHADLVPASGLTGIVERARQLETSVDARLDARLDARPASPVG